MLKHMPVGHNNRCAADMYGMCNATTTQIIAYGARRTSNVSRRALTYMHLNWSLSVTSFSKFMFNLIE